MRKLIVLALVLLLASFAQAVNYIEYGGDMETGGSPTTPPLGVENPYAVNGEMGVDANVPPGGGTQSVFVKKTGPGPMAAVLWAVGLTENTDYVLDFWYKGSAVVVKAEGYPTPGAGISIDGPHSVFWADYSVYVNSGGLNPETDWLHCTAHDGVHNGTNTEYAPAPWVIHTPAGCTTLKFYFENAWAWNPAFPTESILRLDNVTLSDFDPNAPVCVGPYMITDLSQDCQVNFLDFSIMAISWLDCSYENDPNCIDL